MKNHFTILFFIYLFIPYHSFSNDDVYQEFKKAAKTSHIDTNILVEFHNYVRSIRYSETDKCIEIINESLPIFKKRNLTLYEGFFNEAKGDAYWHKGEYLKTIEYLKKAEKLYVQSDSKGSSYFACYTKASLGYTYSDMDQNEKALEIYIEALDYANEVVKNDVIEKEYEELVTIIYSHLGRVYSLLNRHQKSIDAYKACIRFYEKSGVKRNVIISNNNICTVFMEMEQMDSAQYYCSKAQELLQDFDDEKLEANNLYALGSIFLIQEKFEEAEKAFFEAKKIYEKINNRAGILNITHSLSNTYLNTGDVSKAKMYIDSTNLIASDINKENMYAKSVLNLSKYYGQIGNYKLAYKHHVDYLALKDSLFNQQMAEKINSITRNFEFKQKELEIENLQKSNDLQKVELEKSEERSRRLTLQKYMFGGGLVLLVILSFFIYRSYLIKKKSNINLSEKNKLILKQKLNVEKQKDIIEQKSNEIADSINYAKRIQNAILPSKENLNKHLKNGFVFFNPKDVVSGDFYWLEKINDQIYFAAADCTGHGVPGAMVSVVCANALSKALMEEGETEVGLLLDKTRELVIQQFDKGGGNVNDGMDISLIALLNKPSEGSQPSEGLKVSYAGANNPLWVVRKGDFSEDLKNKYSILEHNGHHLLEIKADKQPIGKYFKSNNFTSHQLNLQKGDNIYVFTDGYADQFGGENLDTLKAGGKKFKLKNLKKLLLSIQDKNMDQQHDYIQEVFNKWKGDLEQIDDVCIIGVRI